MEFNPLFETSLNIIMKAIDKVNGHWQMDKKEFELGWFSLD
jgi:hypothetical protein